MDAMQFAEVGVTDKAKIDGEQVAQSPGNA
jgi:hypothetical protein